MSDEFVDDFSMDGQPDVCSFLNNIIDHRESMQQLLNWMRDSQTNCIGSHCLDDIVGMQRPESANQSGTDMYTSLMLFLTIVIGMLVFFGNRRQDQLPDSVGKVDRSYEPINDDDDRDSFGNGA